MAACLQLVADNKVLTNLCRPEYSKCLILSWVSGWMCLHLWSCNDIINNALFHSSPHIKQTLPKIAHILHFCLINSLLSCTPDVVNWIEIMAFYDHKSGVINARQLASYSSCARHLFWYFRPRSQLTMTATEDWERPSLSISGSGLWPAFLAECQILHCSHIFFIVCALWLVTASLWSVKQLTQ